MKALLLIALLFPLLVHANRVFSVERFTLIDADYYRHETGYLDEEGAFVVEDSTKWPYFDSPTYKEVKAVSGKTLMWKTPWSLYKSTAPGYLDDIARSKTTYPLTHGWKYYVVKYEKGARGGIIGSTFPATTHNLAKISGRTHLSVGKSATFGFALTSKTKVLVRVLGPALADSKSPLANPKLSLFSKSKLTAQNNDWSETAKNRDAVAAASKRLKLKGLRNGSKDAALVVTLPKGTYTVEARATSSTAKGEIGFELYEVPIN